MERSLGQHQVNRDDAIVILAGGPAVLVLNSGGLVPLLGTTGLVKDTDDVRAAITAAIKETGAAGIKDMGKVIAALRAKYAGQMDFGKASGMVKAALTG